MDRFTKIYSLIIGLLILLLLGWWLNSLWQPRLWELNEILEEDSKLQEYVYPFRAVAISSDRVTLSSPRSFQVPAIQFLRVIHPDLSNKSQGDPAMMEAQSELVAHQKHAQSLMLAEPDIEHVEWRLDVQWLSDRGVQIPPDAGVSR